MINDEFENFNEHINRIEFKIFEHGLLHTGPEWKFSDLSSPFNRLYFVLSGNASINNLHNNLLLKEGHAYIIPLNEAYDYKCENYLNKFYIHFRIEILPGIDLLHNNKKCIQMPLSVKTMNELVELAKNRTVSDIIKCKGLLLQIIADMIMPITENLYEQAQISNKYSNVYQYINENCFADLRIIDIAKSMNMSSLVLSKNFKNDTGLNLKKLINSKLILKAQELLLTTTMSVKDISYKLRFIDEFYFSKFFKKNTGLPPHVYRQRNNNFK